MSKASDLADWLRAVERLRPSDQEALDAIAQLIGLQLKDVTKASSVSRRKPATSQTQQATPPSPPQETVPESKPRRRLESVLTPGNASRDPAPVWLAAARHLEAMDPARIQPAMPLEPLFPGEKSRAILSDALATPFGTGPLHLPKIVDLLSRAEHIREIPRESIPTLARGVQVLIDTAEAMQPFAADQALLRTILASVVGRDRIQVLYFDKLPSWGAGLGPKEDWPDYETPAPGTPVLVLTDLGIGRVPGVAGLAGVPDWQEFSNRLARRGCPLMALVPYPRQRWPSALSNFMIIVQWDRPTTASVIRRAIPAGLRVLREV